jgi:hypothetical protein
MTTRPDKQIHIPDLKGFSLVWKRFAFGVGVVATGDTQPP